MNTKQHDKSIDRQTKKITRKEALKKAGTFALLTAATTMLVLRPKDAPAQSPGPARPTRWDD